MPHQHEIARFISLRSPRTRQTSTYFRISAYPQWADPTDLVTSIKSVEEPIHREKVLEVASEFVDSDRFLRAEDSLACFRFIRGLGDPIAAPDRLVEKMRFDSVGRRSRFLSLLTDDWQRIGDCLVATTLLGTAGDQDATIDFQQLLRRCQLIHDVFQVQEGEAFPETRFDQIRTAVIELPPIFQPVCFEHSPWGDPSDDGCETPSRCCPKVKPYVADLMMIRQELACYEAEELAYIENVLRGEERLREHRHLVRSEVETETETSRKTLREKDHQISSRYKLSNAVDEITKSEVSAKAGVTLTAKYGKNLTLTSNYGIATSSSSQTTDKTATEHARDVTQRAKNRVEQTYREKQTVKLLEETEETNRHSLSNVEGTEHQVGLYHWVTEVYKAQVINYGSRMMVECFLPEPSRLYRYFNERHQAEKVNELDPGPPPKLDPSQISDDPKDPNYYLKLIDQYDLTGIEAPPPPELSVSSTALYYNKTGDIALDTLSRGDGLRLHRFSQEGEGGGGITIPPDYEAYQLSASGTLNWGSGSPKSLVITVGSAKLVATGSSGLGTAPMAGEQGTLSVHAASWTLTTFDLTITVKCRRTAAAYDRWKIAVFERVIEAYTKKKERFDLARTEEAQEQASKFRARPFRYREIERRELERMFISCVSCQFYDDFDAMRDCVNPCKYPQMNATEAEKEGRMVRFFNHALELEHMTYLFYPYFWMNKCDWGDRLEEDSEDLLFRQFLQAGFARVQVPVRPGFEEIFLHYLETRQIWNREDPPPCPGTTYCLSMVDELRRNQRFGQTFREGCLDMVGGEPRFTVQSGTDLTTEDQNHEILIDCTAYRIKDLELATDGQVVAGTLDRPYEGESETCVPFAVGGLYVGAPWEVRLPTELIYLPKAASCLPKFPMPPCEE